VSIAIHILFGVIFPAAICWFLGYRATTKLLELRREIRDLIAQIDRAIGPNRSSARLVEPTASFAELMALLNDAAAGVAPRVAAAKAISALLNASEVQAKLDLSAAKPGKRESVARRLRSLRKPP
jgi:hypothetical protein